MSVGQLADKNYFTGFDDTSCSVLYLLNRRIIRTSRDHRGPSMFLTPSTFLLSHLQIFLSAVILISTSCFSFAQWHHRLGLLCVSHLSTLVHQGVLFHVPIDVGFKFKGCKLGKQIQLSYPSSTNCSGRPFN